ncbi:MAG: hypothetical protein GC168_15055 [Candidatus Hydrogenedens sp.]|nr:hypothetical protein [Candidatus Hydrogenedens sp.]
MAGAKHSLHAMALLPALAMLLMTGSAPAEESVETTTVEAAPAEEAAPAPEAEAATESEDAGRTDREWIRGRFETGFDAAWDGKGSDFELYQILRMEIAPPKADKLTLHGSLWMTEDLDGDEARYSRLYSIDDGYGGDVRARVLDLYLQADDVLGGAQLRLGRQRILDGPLYNRIDGLRLRWDKPQWDAYAYAGSRASLYEDPFEDLVLGAGAGFRPTENTRLGIDLFRADDDRSNDEVVRGNWWSRLLNQPYPRTVDTRVEDQTLGLSVYHRFNENHWMNAQVLLQGDGAHELTVDFTGYIPRLDLTYLVDYRRQFDRVNDRTDEMTGYYRVLGGLEAYNHVHLGVQRPLTEKLTLGFEADIHDAARNDVYNTNRDYLRLATVLSGKDLGNGFGFNVSLDHWNTSDGDGSWVLTGEINREWNAYEWAIGVDFEQYRYEYIDYNPWPKWIKTSLVLAVPGVFPGFSPVVWFTDTRAIVERDEIYSAYTRFVWNMDERQRITAKLSYEDDDGPYTPYWQIRAAYELEF